MDELVGSRDAEHRNRLESEFAAASDLVQADLISRLTNLPIRHFEILRLALRSESPQIRRAAIDSLASMATPAGLSLFDQACDQAETLGGLEPLLIALQRLAPDHAEADRLARTRTGIYGESSIVDLEGWLSAMGESRTTVAATSQNLGIDLEALDRLLTALTQQAQRAPNDGEIQLSIAAANIEYGQAQLMSGRDPSFLFQDALQAARLAGQRGAAKGLAKGYEARVHYLLSDFEAATTAASEALPALLTSARSKLSAEVLSVFASCRTRALYEAFNRDSRWPAEWIADIHSAQRVLAHHRFAEQDQAAAHVDLLVFLNAMHQEGQALEIAIERFPDDVQRDANLDGLCHRNGIEIYMGDFPGDRMALDFFQNGGFRLGSVTDGNRNDDIAFLLKYFFERGFRNTQVQSCLMSPIEHAGNDPRCP